MRTNPHKFIADAMLGRLARRLRILGYDTLYSSSADNEIIKKAETEDRIILTRDADLYRRKSGAIKIFISMDKITDQLRELKKAVGLVFPAADFFKRCPICNGNVADIKREDAEGLVAPFILCTNDRFSRCETCEKIYWEGSHAQKIRAIAAELNKEAEK